MNNRFAKTALAAAIALATGSAGAAIVTNLNNNAAQLAAALAGGGIAVVAGSEVLTTDTQNGTFTGGLSTGLGIDTGVILTTGDLSCVPGPNNSASCSGGGVSADLKFKFTTTTGDLFFKYVFGSEEYNEFVGLGYNDLFTLLVDGVNVALIPGGGGAVNVDNVNCGSNSAYYRNNSNAINNCAPQNLNLQYDGFTTVLTASKLGLGAGEHTMELFISDQGDGIYDSGVFIAGGSFTGTDPNPTPEPATLALFGVALAGLGFSRRRKLQA